MSESHSETVGVPVSLLDTDLYKLTMQHAVFRRFPTVQTSYQFTNRSRDMLFTKEAVQMFQSAVSKFSDLRLTETEYTWLQTECPFLSSEYLDYLSDYRFKPDQVQIIFEATPSDESKGNVCMSICGPWVDTIMWEVPLLACLSEVYFKMVDTDWTYDSQEEQAFEKGRALLQAGCAFSEFGTRRRRSYHAQDLAVAGLLRASKEVEHSGKLTGTSNVFLAQKYGLKPIGTIAHEWFMAIAALSGYEHANLTAMDIWEQVYGSSLLIALTDTFSSRVFFQDLSTDVERAKRWQGLRHDSGDPKEFAPQAKALYEKLGIDPKSKLLLYSDSLDVERAVALKNQCDELDMQCAFGIGTFFTNDFKKASIAGHARSKPLNIVIKLSSVDSIPCVKISDDLTKNTGDPATVQRVKKDYGLPT